MDTMYTSNLTEICLTFQQARFYTGVIPKEFVKIARKRFSIPIEDQLIAFLSCNLFGNGNYGVYFTTSGLYWKNWGVGKGRITWKELSKVQHIDMKEEVLLFDSKEQFNISMSTYPPTLFRELLTTILEFNRQYSSDRLCQEQLIDATAQGNEIRRICTLFEVYGKLEPDNGLYVVSHISKKRMNRIVDRFHILDDDGIIAILDTSFLGVINKGELDGILLCESGIYFRETFVNLYFPWHIFCNLPIALVGEELILGKGNKFHLQFSRMPGEEVLLFLKNLQKNVHSLYECNDIGIG